MALFVISVDKYCYCELEIDDQPMQASANLISQILLHEGFGIGLPTLTIYFQDQSGTLQNEMNLIEGIRCTVSLAKDPVKDKRTRRSYRLWHIVREVNNDGPVLKAVFIFDNAKFGTSVYCEAYRGSSSAVMGNIASTCDIEYDGPESTDDSMTWLNAHTTRLNFTEDIANRGYASDSSCMVRVLTMDNKLVYKDMYKVLGGEVDATFMLNDDGKGKKKPLHNIRETKMIGASGVISHWVNYGQKQYNHSLDKSGDWTIDGINAPVFGTALPVNEKVRSSLDAPARVNYVGFDPGTAPAPASNIHENYEEALYQNIRNLGLFSERLRVLTDDFTKLSSLKCVEYVQKDGGGGADALDSKSNNGKYVIVGKTISVKNGHQYVEIFDLLRPYVHTGEGINADGGAATKATQVKANKGPIDLTADRVAQLNATANAPTVPPNIAKPSYAKPEADQLNNVMGSLVEFNKAVPAIPEKPLGGPGSLSNASPEVVAQAKVADAIKEINKSDSALKQAITVSPDAFNPERAITVKKISAATVETSANNTLQAVLDNEGKTPLSNTFKGVGLNGLSLDQLSALDSPVEKQVLDRFTLDTGADPLQALKNEPLYSALPAARAEAIAVDSFVTDPLRGGVFTQDYIDLGNIPPNIADMRPVDAVKSVADRGTNFTFPAAKFGLEPRDVLISPAAVVDYAEDFVERTKDPARFLREQGAQKYADTFGSRMPEDALDVVNSIADKIPGLRNAFGVNEVLAGDPTSTAEQSGFGVALGGVMKFGSAVGITPTVDINSYQLTGAIADGVNGVKNDTGFSKIFNFRFGGSGVGPIVEKVVSKERVSSSDTITATTDILRMNRDTLSWASFTRMGNDNSKRYAAQNPASPQPVTGTGYPDPDYKHWTYPAENSVAVISEGEGSAFSFSSKKTLS